jgi:hypothetical protein
MVRFSWPALLGLILPLALVVVNVVLGYGGLLVLILLLVWLAMGVIFLYPEETA